MSDVLENSEIQQDVVMNNEEIKSLPPSMNQDGWSNFLLSQLLPDEKREDKYPTCEGLRRLVETYIGPIIKRTSKVIEAPKTPDGISTIQVGITVVVTNESHPAKIALEEQTYLMEECVADCGPYNTDKPYCRHQSATAETKAESRALRKLLKLRNIVSAEEVGRISDEVERIDAIENVQIGAMETLAKRSNVNLEEFIKNLGFNKPVLKLNKDEAVDIIKALNETAQKFNN